MRQELDEIDGKLEQWGNATEEELDELGNEIEADFNEFKQSVRGWVD
jgi:hypothetical protein